MRSKLLILLLVFTLSLLMLTTTSAQTDDSDEVAESQMYDGETSEVAEVPLIGWYLVPVLGAMRRHRHELNDRSYTPEVSEKRI